ncbi:hypothetical protein [Streptomyces sp. SP18BB07]|uniref:hypothetical protein n=1 Tax=Streptomyces sp. SP18BB07 TaxID=3002522 RepID=UPI002E78A3C4|nr:hypothetical protein [Streptomyces sp. SP18BB07]MEE1763399.1 hypothetical protein [Streptomyces sp. SP18BB07]
MDEVFGKGTVTEPGSGHSPRLGRLRHRYRHAQGGTGKTTSAWFIALYYAVVLGLPTLLLDTDATSKSAWDWFKVAQAEDFEIPENLVVEWYPFDDIAECVRAKRAEFGAIVVDAGGAAAPGSSTRLLPRRTCYSYRSPPPRSSAASSWPPSTRPSAPPPATSRASPPMWSR